MVVDFCRSKPTLLPVHIDGVNVEVVSTYKYLGLHLTINWTEWSRWAQTRRAESRSVWLLGDELMPPAMTDVLDLWAELGQGEAELVTVDFLLPTGLYIQMDVPREATIQHIKLLLWKQAAQYPLFPALGQMEGCVFECVSSAAVHEELDDESRRLCDVRPFLPVLRLLRRSGADNQRVLSSKIGTLIGKGLQELDSLPDQEVKDFRQKMQRISEEKLLRMQMMSYWEWLQSCFSPQMDVAPTDEVIDKLMEGGVKITIHYDQCQDTASVRVCVKSKVDQLVDQALRKWSSTHQQEGCHDDYILRVSGKLEFLCGKHPLIQYKIPK
ncbi:hypothetical protein AALO_G00207030 [Alosa alosa]|uniref:phosphatidylinositol-4,5-bisphosphate 3-kinase n=1 Tax=Alosa alosa TaxID=278164 RepID=A0AAV6GAZ2_9TELE|nr:hypothetical protein AALO_G00207030 [Alosa alosa]